MNLLVTIDPGKRKCGIAEWRDGELSDARLIKSKSKSEEPSEYIAAMAQAVVDHTKRAPQMFVCEYPQTYRGRAARGDANDLIAVALVAGVLFSTFGSVNTERSIVLPHEWKGSIPKPESKAEYDLKGYIVETRARAELSPVELARVRVPGDWRHAMDVWDAVGIGLWTLKKLKLRPSKIS